ncbi:MAG: S-layer homology domain-containing protein [Clostridia bacterium]|nr:S-layer homology domain-containing protein [Clostridia bacterium]
MLCSRRASRSRRRRRAAKGGFSDVSSDDYFCNAVLWAVVNNVTSGTGAKTFSPADVCTRGQIVTFMYRAK